MEREWAIYASFNLGGKQMYVMAFGPAPRIYEALGSAKSAIALAYRDADMESIDFTCAMEVPFEGNGKWYVRETVAEEF